MKLSIIIPVYNAEKYIGECIKSILQCDSSDIEIIIINDGSKDKSLSIIKEYQKNDKRIYIIDKENEGVSIARNTGIKEAKGDWIMFVDADDILTNDWFDIIKGYMSSDFKILFFTNYLKRNLFYYFFHIIYDILIWHKIFRKITCNRMVIFFVKRVITKLCNKSRYIYLRVCRRTHRHLCPLVSNFFYQ